MFPQNMHFLDSVQNLDLNLTLPRIPFLILASPYPCPILGLGPVPEPGSQSDPGYHMVQKQA